MLVVAVWCWLVLCGVRCLLCGACVVCCWLVFDVVCRLVLLFVVAFVEWCRLRQCVGVCCWLVVVCCRVPLCVVARCGVSSFGVRCLLAVCWCVLFAVGADCVLCLLFFGWCVLVCAVEKCGLVLY